MLGCSDFHDWHWLRSHVLANFGIHVPQSIDQVEHCFCVLACASERTIDFLWLFINWLDLLFQLDILQLKRHLIICKEGRLKHASNFSLFLFKHIQTGAVVNLQLGGKLNSSRSKQVKHLCFWRNSSQIGINTNNWVSLVIFAASSCATSHLEILWRWNHNVIFSSGGLL